MRVHDGLGLARGTRREKDDERMITRDGRKGGLDLFAGEVGIRLGPGRKGGVLVEITQKHGMHGGQFFANSRQLGRAVNALSAPDITVDGNDDFGVELTNAIHDTRGTHLGWHRTPHGSQAHRGEVGRNCLGNVGQVSHHAIAHTHTGATQAGLQPTDFLNHARGGPVA